MKESKIDLNSTKAEATKQIQHLRRDKAAPSCFQEFHFTVMVQRPPQDVFRLVANIAQLSSASISIVSLNFVRRYIMYENAKSKN